MSSLSPGKQLLPSASAYPPSFTNKINRLVADTHFFVFNSEFNRNTSSGSFEIWIEQLVKGTPGLSVVARGTGGSFLNLFLFGDAQKIYVAVFDQNHNL